MWMHSNPAYLKRITVTTFMEAKRRKTDCYSSSSESLTLDFLQFGLDQIDDYGILLLEVKEDVLTPVFANSYFCRLFGVSRDFYASFVLQDFIAQEDVPLFKNCISSCSTQQHRLRILTRRQEEASYRLVQKDARVTCSRFSNELICCKFQLCTASLEEKLKWYQIAERHLGIPWGFFRVHEKSKDLCVIFENDLARAIRGPYTEETAYYYKSDGLMSEDQLSWWVERASKVNENHLEELSTRETNILGVNHSFTIRHIFVDRDENGFPIVLGVCEDMSRVEKLQTIVNDQQKHLDELDSTNKCLRHFFDLAPLYMGVVQLVNNDTDASELGGTERIGRWVQQFLKAKATNQVVEFEEVYLDRAGQAVYQQAFCVYVGADLFAYKMTIQILISRYLCQDITRNRKLEEELTKHKMDLEEKIRERTRQLQEALQVKSRFLATMSHEMRTPLSGSTGAMSLLEETSLSPDQRNLLRIAQVCSQQLLSVINDVLDLSKLEENKVVLEKEPFDIRNTLEESLEMVCFDASKKGLELISVIDPSVPETVVGDAGRLRQIIVNLLSNSVKFSSKGEIVLRATAKRIESTEDMAEITMSVQDEGIGIQEEDKHKLFQVFTQLDNSVTRRHGGTGLGLSICKRLAELMHGKIWFESNEGKGSTFYTTILAPILLAQVTHFQRASKPLKCVIVDKSSTYARQLKMLLENLGNYAECVTNLEEAEGADCLFADARFSLKSIQEVPNCKHIILTSYTIHQVKIPPECFLLEKPLRECKLRQLLDSIQNNVIPVCKQPEPSDNNMGNIPKDVSILLAEDNEMNQQIITRMLNNLSFWNIQVVGNGLQAIEQVRSKHHDLVFMDVMMPDMGGIEATEIIRKEFGDKPVIVALTANAFAEDRTRCLEAGMQEVLTKPVQKTELTRIFRMFFATK